MYMASALERLNLGSRLLKRRAGNSFCTAASENGQFIKGHYTNSRIGYKLYVCVTADNKRHRMVNSL